MSTLIINPTSQTTESLYDSQTRQINKLWEINESLRGEILKKENHINQLKESLHQVSVLAIEAQDTKP